MGLASARAGYSKGAFSARILSGRTVIAMVDVPEPGGAIEAGLKLTVTSLGSPDADKAMAESKRLRR